jgi:hypothetical protein
MEVKYTDTELLNFLQSVTTGYGGGWILRISNSGRGWRLHETTLDGATKNVRYAIAKEIDKRK